MVMVLYTNLSVGMLKNFMKEKLMLEETFNKKSKRIVSE
jgi:hypothetical protein